MRKWRKAAIMRKAAIKKSNYEQEKVTPGVTD